MSIKFRPILCEKKKNCERSKFNNFHSEFREFKTGVSASKADRVFWCQSRHCLKLLRFDNTPRVSPPYPRLFAPFSSTAPFSGFPTHQSPLASKYFAPFHTPRLTKKLSLQFLSRVDEGLYRNVFCAIFFCNATIM